MVISLFRKAPKCRTKVLHSVPKCETVICFMAKIHVLDKLHLGRNSGAVGCEFNVQYCILI